MNMNVNNNIPVTSSYGIENTSEAVAGKATEIKECQVLENVQGVNYSKVDLPVISLPLAKEVSKNTYENGLSAAALILSMIAKTLAEQAHENRLAQYDAQMASAEVLEKEAKEIESNATNKLICSIVANTVSMVGGCIQLGMCCGKNVSELTLKEADAIGKLFDKVGGISSATGEYLSGTSDASQKRLQSEQTRLNAIADQLKSFSESMMQTVSRALDTYNNMQSTSAETMRKILG
ncbi:MAG: hypothetical protein ACI4NE_05795 [Succinivibrio sp.]